MSLNKLEQDLTDKFLEHLPKMERSRSLEEAFEKVLKDPLELESEEDPRSIDPDAELANNIDNDMGIKSYDEWI